MDRAYDAQSCPACHGVRNMSRVREWFSWRMRQGIGLVAGLVSRPAGTTVGSMLCIVEGGLGDRLMALPALRHLRSRYASASMTVMLSGPMPSCVAEEFDVVCDWSGWNLWRRINTCRRGYDLCYISSVGVYNPLNEILALVSGAHLRIGPRYEHVTRTAYSKSYVFGTGAHETVINARAVGWAGDDTALPYALRQQWDADPRKDEPRPVVLHPGCREGYDQKRWPIGNFRELARVVGDRHRDGALVVGSPSERPIVEAIAEGLARVQTRITQTLDELSEVLKGSAAFVGNDSGPAHLAAALGTPTVVLMSATLPERCAPVGSSVHVLYEPCDLGGCYYVRGARCRGCISRIGVPAVVQQIEPLLTAELSRIDRL